MSDQTGGPDQPGGGSGYVPPAPPPPEPGWTPTGEPATATAPPPPPTPPTAVGTAMEPEGRRRDRGGPLWIGLIFVVIGIIVLVGQFLPAVSLWALWPLVIVIAGAIQAVTRGHEGWNVNRLFDGLVTIAFGLVLLGNTTGVIGWSVWWRFIWLWPILLIAAGVGIIGRAVGQRWIGIIGSILVIGALAYAAATTYAGYTPTFSITSTTGAHHLSYSQPVAGASEAALELDAGAGEVNIAGGTDLVNVEATSPWGTPSASVVRSGSRADVKVVSSEGNGSIYIPGTTDARTDVKLSTSTPWTITINSGAVTLGADFKDVPVSSLVLKTGVSDSTFAFGAPDLATATSGARPISVKSGVSSVTLRFPATAPVRVSFSTGLSGNSVPTGYSKVGEVYESASFSASQAYWDVTIESGVGSSKIETY